MGNARRTARRIVAEGEVRLPAAAINVLADLAMAALRYGRALQNIQSKLEDNDEGAKFLGGIIESLKDLHKAQWGATSDEDSSTEGARPTAGLGGICVSCGAENEFVNQCGCDPNNMPPAPTGAGLDELEMIDAEAETQDGEPKRWEPAPDHFKRLREQQQWDRDRRRQRGNDLPPGR